VEPGARTPPTEPLNSVSPVESVGAADQQREHPRRVAGRVQRLDGQAADLELPGRAADRGGAGDLAALLGVDQHLGVGIALLQLVEIADVSPWRVGEQDVRDVELVLVGLGDQGLDRGRPASTKKASPPGRRRRR
jgi:hypothetical protein